MLCLSLVYLLQNNPSVCAKYIDSSTERIIVICDCAPGFYGIDFCEPIADYVRLPPLFSALAGAHLKHPALLNGVYDETVELPGYDSQLPAIQDFSIPLNPFGTTVRVPINVVFSAFKIIDGSRFGQLLPTPSKNISINMSINQPLPSSLASMSYSTLGMGLNQRRLSIDV